MYVRKKKYPSGNIGIIVVEKTNGKMNELVTIGIASSDDEIDGFVNQGKEWIEREKERRHPRLDLFGDERRKCEQERMDAERLLSNITNITVNGADLILDRVFDNVGFIWCDRLYYCDSGGYGYHAGAGNRILFPEQREKECNEGGCF